jgi:cell division protein FtsZ
MEKRASMRDGLNELFRRTDDEAGQAARDTETRSPSPLDEPIVGGDRPYVTTIKVVGVGGAGTNAVNRMVDSGIRGVEFIAVNTDIQSLATCDADVKIHIGQEITHGLGGGADPEVGRLATEGSHDELKQALRGADLVFVTAGEGGGTGTGGAPVIAAVARELGALAVAIVTRPFSFEGHQRLRQAEKGIAALRATADTVITIPNDRLLAAVDRTTSVVEAFRFADDVLRQGVQGITDLITVPGLINLDFADVRTIVQNAGTALMGVGRASGDDRAMAAAQAAITSPLLETSIEGARGILLNITGGEDLSLYEVNEAAGAIAEAAHEDANIIFGALMDAEMAGSIAVTVIATGFGQPAERAFADAAAPPGDEAPERRDDVGTPLGDTGAPLFESPPSFDDGELDIPSFVRRTGEDGGE